MSHHGKQLIALDEAGRELAAFPVDNAVGVATDGTRLVLNRLNLLEARADYGGKVLTSVAKSCLRPDLAWDSKRGIFWLMEGSCGYLVKVDRALNVTQSIPFSVIDPQGQWNTQLIGLGLAWDSRRDVLYASFARQLRNAYAKYRLPASRAA